MCLSVSSRLSSVSLNRRSCQTVALSVTQSESLYSSFVLPSRQKLEKSDALLTNCQWERFMHGMEDVYFFYTLSWSSIHMEEFYTECTWEENVPNTMVPFITSGFLGLSLRLNGRTVQHMDSLSCMVPCQSGLLSSHLEEHVLSQTLVVTDKPSHSGVRAGLASPDPDVYLSGDYFLL